MAVTVVPEVAGAGVTVDRVETRWWRPLPVAALIFAGYLVLAVACYWNAWSTEVTRVSFPAGDQYLEMWFLSWTPFAVLHGHNVFFTTYVNYPYGANLLVNTSELFLGALASPITLVFGPIAAFNVMLTLALALSAFSMYGVASHFVRWRPAAVVAGLVYGFSPYEIAQGAGHLFLSFTPLPPLILFLVYRICAEHRGSPVRSGVLLGLLVTAQFFVNTEVLADTVLIALVGLVLLCLAGHRDLGRHWRPAAVGLGWGAGVSAVLLCYPAWSLLAGPASISGTIRIDPQGYRADLAGSVVPGIFQALAPARFVHLSSGFGGNPVENGSYLGIGLLLVVLVGTVLLWRRMEVRVCALLGLCAYVVSLGDRLVVSSPSNTTPGGLLLPGWLLFHLPLFSNAVPVRFSLFVMLFAALLLAFTIDGAHSSLLAHHSGATVWSVTAPLAIAAVAIVPVVPSMPYANLADLGAPGVYTDGTLQRVVPRSSTIVTYPYADNTNALPQLWQAQTFMHFKMPGSNMQVPRTPSKQLAFTPLTGNARATTVGVVFATLAAGESPGFSPATRRAVAAELETWHIVAVVATPSAASGASQATAYLRWLFGPPSLVDRGTLVWRVR